MLESKLTGAVNVSNERLSFLCFILPYFSFHVPQDAKKPTPKPCTLPDCSCIILLALWKQRRTGGLPARVLETKGGSESSGRVTSSSACPPRLPTPAKDG